MNLKRLLLKIRRLFETSCGRHIDDSPTGCGRHIDDRSPIDDDEAPEPTTLQS